MEPLYRVLQGREERARLQSWLFGKGLLVIQVSLNIPGFPKRLKGDIPCVDRAGIEVREAIVNPGGSVLQEIGLLNGAGYALLIGALSEESPFLLKKRCVGIEEGLSWGRALDIDVLVPGGSVSRQSLGEPSRRCFLCGEEAKVCARDNRHDRKELRRVLEGLLLEPLQEGASSPSSRARSSASSSFR